MDGAHHLHQIRILLADNGFVSVLEEVPVTLVGRGTFVQNVRKSLNVFLDLWPCAR